MKRSWGYQHNIPGRIIHESRTKSSHIMNIWKIISSKERVEVPQYILEKDRDRVGVEETARRQSFEKKQKLCITVFQAS
ncbi:hypothetical protein [Methermicoccus shengliensis]|uniref:Uncharacterized protein n=1 Tax=Methermicoccus shengliensis TaxID=660064 RepID=A0A832VZP1_9EURY|nr:hypothetical protein [Methermicoccus shengliensis]HIH69724.1 hypothetical protein [Methermicoccus shengliensis]